MLTCQTAEALVMKEVDGLLTGQERAELDSHAGVCEGCRTRREAHLIVATALARRNDAPAPDGFARRVSERVSPAVSPDWLVAVDWRRWTEWMLPVAAALVLVAALAAGRGTASSSAVQSASADATARALQAWAWGTGSEGAPGAAAFSQNVTNEELLAAMLGVQTADFEGSGNAR